MKINDKTFLSTFLGLIFLVLLTIFYLHKLDSFKPYSLLSIVGFVIYSLTTLWIYFMAKIYTSNSMDTKFAKLIYINTGVKFIVTLLLPVVFYFIYDKPDGTFILPFLFIYIVFTIYTTWLLNKMAVMR